MSSAGLGGFLSAVPIPINDPIAQPKRASFKNSPDPQEGKVTLPWVDFFTSQGDAVAQASTRVASVAFPSQAASIGATDISGGNLPGGVYAFEYHATITTPDGVSSSLAIILDWVYLGAAKSYNPGVAITGDTTGDSQSNRQLIIIDEASPVRYSTVYSSNTPGQMQYTLIVVLQRIDA